MRRSAWATVAAGWLTIAAIAGLAAGLGGEERKPETVQEKLAEAADVGGPFPLEVRSPQIVAGTSQRVLVALRRPSVAELASRGRLTALEQRAHVRSLRREARALMSALSAKGVRFGRPEVFGRVWSGFAATIATDDLPAVQQVGLRVEAVRRFYPAAVPGGEAPAVRPLPAKAQPEAVALLDAVESTPAARRLLGSRLRVVASTVDGGTSAADREGLSPGVRMAHVLARELPRTSLHAIRAARRQGLETGRLAIYATTDQLLAGLERVVDPDGDGDSSDAYPVAVTSLASPYSGFERAPEAQAVDGAAVLGTLVVAPAGNGGISDGPFGTIASPGAAAGALTVAALDGSGDPAPGSSRGPTYGWSPKPDVAIGGGAEGAGWGTAVAAARAGGVAAALRAERPELTARQAAAALIGTAAPRGTVFEGGGGDPLLQAARVTSVVADPPSLVLRPGRPASVRITNVSRKTVALTPTPGSAQGPAAQPARLRLRPGRTATVRLQAPAAADPSLGRIEAGPIGIPYAVVGAEPPRPPLGRLRLVRSRGSTTGVRFTAGGIDRGDRGASVVPVGALVLTVDGAQRRELTPPGGARDLLPGEYAYTLTPDVLRGLPAGRYRFVVRARGTAGGAAVVRRSRTFSLR